MIFHSLDFYRHQININKEKMPILGTTFLTCTIMDFTLVSLSWSVSYSNVPLILFDRCSSLILPFADGYTSIIFHYQQPQAFSYPRKIKSCSWHSAWHSAVYFLICDSISKMSIKVNSVSSDIPQALGTVEIPFMVRTWVQKRIYRDFQIVKM